MKEMGRRPVETALTRRFVSAKAVIALASTVVVSWQNQLFLAPIALANGCLAGYFWTSLIVFPAMHVVYIGLREKAERWPASAGQFFWIAHLAPRRCARQLSFLSGWMLTVSWQIFLGAGVMIIGNAAATLVVLHTGSNRFWLPTVLSMLTALCIFAINRWCLPLLAKLKVHMLVFHVAVFFLFVAVLLGLRAHSGLPYATASSVFLTFRNSGGWVSNAGAAFIAALVPLSSAVGYDCLFHLSEEIKSAASIVPAALTWCAMINFSLGLITALVIDFSVADINAVFGTPLSRSGPIGPVVQIIYTATASLGWTTAIVTLLAASVVPCCINSFTAASRQLWAFAENGGLPGSTWIQQVYTTDKLPSKAIWLTLIGPIVLPLLNLLSKVALNAVASVVINNLIASYLLVAGSSIYARYTRYGIFPPVVHPEPAEINWATALFGGSCLAGGLLYYYHGRKNYRGPLDKAQALDVVAPATGTA
ncbi:hypothetical protein B0A55_09569 [Friedmanniomyces simplex]|uniref:Amino acid permease/ SLC12A domain-containing protein n=1 Tax=Friedmanniomyces simplex TaxID=329884 RepID=A0A4V5NEZ3_9PEZI|nr:hypothetical protein B0A55_09569 [Friedmanniomyces simplex]